jgi:serine/threonine-protein kinase HipA
MAEPLAIEARLWGRTVGAVAPLPARPGFYEFQYDPAFAISGLEIAPLTMPLDARRRYSFPSLNQDTYYGLPGAIADALPDKFGNMLINEYMARHGMRPQDVTTLQRLLYMGRRGMGALEFEPALRSKDSPDGTAPLEMAQLVEDARRALRGEANRVTQEIIDVGSSAGGARAKAVIGWNPKTREVVSGQFDLPDAFEHWLLKFDVGDDQQLGTTKGFGRIEYAHYLLACEAGIEMSPCELLEENDRAHFMTKRFDRIGNEKLHVQSLCALMHLDFNAPRAHGYEQFLRAILQLNLGADAVEQAWLRCAFNVAFINCDDHTKNLAFLMDPRGAWRLAPAFDMCFAHNPAVERWTSQHQMLVNAKSWNISREDVLGMGDTFGVNRRKELFDNLLDVRARWPRIGAKAGVPTQRIKEIAALHPALSAPKPTRKRQTKTTAAKRTIR